MIQVLEGFGPNENSSMQHLNLTRLTRSFKFMRALMLTVLLLRAYKCFRGKEQNENFISCNYAVADLGGGGVGRVDRSP